MSDLENTVNKSTLQKKTLRGSFQKFVFAHRSGLTALAFTAPLADGIYTGATGQHGIPAHTFAGIVGYSFAGWLTAGSEDDHLEGAAANASAGAASYGLLYIMGNYIGANFR
jgi:hypothetical protein